MLHEDKQKTRPCWFLTKHVKVNIGKILCITLGKYHYPVKTNVKLPHSENKIKKFTNLILEQCFLTFVAS